MIGYQGFKRTQRNAGRQDVPLANQLKATRERTPGPYNTCSFSLRLHSSYASDRGGSIGRQPADRMYATTDGERNTRQVANNGPLMEAVSTPVHLCPPPGVDSKQVVESSERLFSEGVQGVHPLNRTIAWCAGARASASRTIVGSGGWTPWTGNLTGSFRLSTSSFRRAARPPRGVDSDGHPWTPTAVGGEDGW
jgi:hypothetical protein